MKNRSVAHIGRTFHLKIFMLDEPLNLGGGNYPTANGFETGTRERIIAKRAAFYKPDSKFQKTLYALRAGRKADFKTDKETVEAGPFQFDLKFKLKRRTGMVKADPYGVSTGHEHLQGIQKEAKGMAKIKTKRVRWDSSTSPDVAGYKLYWAIGQGVNYDSDSADMGNVNEVILPDEVPSFPRVAGDIEIGVTAVNYKGNESDMSVCSAPFDFTAPEPPLNLVVEDT
jgi:hypothetical protein